MTADELRQFASLLKAYRGGTIDMFQFCTKVKLLLDNERRLHITMAFVVADSLRLYLLPNMKAFIVKEQHEKFDAVMDQLVPECLLLKWLHSLTVHSCSSGDPQCADADSNTHPSHSDCCWSSLSVVCASLHH